jgi:hypothetical protein
VVKCYFANYNDGGSFACFAYFAVKKAALGCLGGPMSHKSVMKIALWVGALYDGILGVAFVFLGPTLFSMFKITPPNHWAYTELAGGFVFVLGVMQAVAAIGDINRRLVWFSIAFKAVYCGVVYYHAALGDIPGLWVVLAACDTVWFAMYLDWLIRKRPPTA